MTAHLPTVSIHSPFGPGQKLAEFVTVHNIDYEFQRMEQGQAACHVNAKDPALNADVLRPGNLMVITAPDMETWAGPILSLPHRLSTGEHEINAFGMGYILANRTLPQDLHPVGKASGLVIYDALTVVNLRSATGIYPGSISTGPRIEDLPLGGLSLLDALNSISLETDWEWSIRVESDPTYLAAYLDWQPRQGEDLSESVHLWNGIHFVDVERKEDLSQIKQAVTVLIDFGANLKERQSVTRTLTPASGRRDINSGIFDVASPQVYDTLEALPPGLRNERVLIDVMAGDGSQAARRAKREQDRHLEAQEQFQISANTVRDWSAYRVGNYVTLHTSESWQDLTRKVRLVTVHPDMERGECVITAEVAA